VVNKYLLKFLEVCRIKRWIRNIGHKNSITLKVYLFYMVITGG